MVRNTQWTTKGVQVCVDIALIVSGANTTIHAEPGKHGHVRNSALVLDLYPGKGVFFLLQTALWLDLLTLNFYRVVV